MIYTVKELIDRLKECKQSANVYVVSDGISADITVDDTDGTLVADREWILIHS